MSKKHPEFTPIEQTVAGRRFYTVFGILAIVGGVGDNELGAALLP